MYNEDGNAHEMYEMEDEEKFKARGDADKQRDKFVAQETDVDDKALVKQKRRERELAESEAEELEEHGVQLAPYTEGPGPLGRWLFTIRGRIGATGDSTSKQEASRSKGQMRRTSGRRRRARHKNPSQLRRWKILEALASGFLE